MVELKRIVFFTVQKLDSGHYSLRTRDGFSFDYKGIVLTIHFEGPKGERVCISDAESGLLVKSFDIYRSEAIDFLDKGEKAVLRVYSLKYLHDALLELYETQYYKYVKKAYKCLLEARECMQIAEKMSEKR